MSDCDAGGFAPLYVIGETPDGEMLTACRCLICARCGHHTGNATQGHYWSYCKVTRTTLEPHFCCPGDCEYGRVP